MITCAVPIPLETTEWTSIEDNLPPPHTICLTLSTEGVIEIKKFCKQKFVHGLSTVAYWIPLPYCRKPLK